MTGGDAGAAAAVRCQGLTKAFVSAAGRIQALRGIDLEVPAGRLTMLVGPSGCGKTTLISVVAGILAADAGRCLVLGVDVAGLAAGDRLDFRARHIGFIFQQFHLLPSLIVADNVAVPLIINGAGRRVAQRQARAILDQVGLADRWQDPPAVLSGGEQQRVAIARALVHGPDLIVCDEPTSALDHDTGQRIMALIQGLVRARGMTVLIVTHDSRIFPFADRIARMDDGRVVGIAAGGADAAAAAEAGG